MTLQDGVFLPYRGFRESLSNRGSVPVAWGWRELCEALGKSFDKEMAGLSLLALSCNEKIEGCEMIPGLSLSIQSLRPSHSTPAHAHAWWHIFVVLSGTGRLKFIDLQQERPLLLNEVIFIPGWCRHSIHNSGNEDFTALNISNMIQQAELSNFKSS